jgi:rhodanese-related sulfurtransferase
VEDKLPPLADWGPARQTYAGLIEIDPEWVAEHLDDVLLLDVRQHEEMDERLGRIETARILPLNELKRQLHSLSQERPLIAVCHAGMRSGQATVLLRQAGFTRVANMRGGMLAWQQLGLPVVHRGEP